MHAGRLVGLVTLTLTLVLAPARASAQSCGNITGVGCCEGSVAKFCSKGVLKTKDCATAFDAGALTCGWVASKSFYSCTTSADVDPSGTYPISCNVVTDGGPPPDAPPGVPCGNIPSQGCCDGETVKYCSTSKNTLSTKDCTASPSCGWDSAKSYYTCGTSGSADPAGTYPMPCSAYESDASTPTGDGPVTQSDGPATQSDGPATQSDGPTVQADSGTPPKSSDDDGCGCGVGRPAASSAWLLLVLGVGLLLAAWRRR